MSLHDYSTHSPALLAQIQKESPYQNYWLSDQAAWKEDGVQSLYYGNSRFGHVLPGYFVWDPVDDHQAGKTYKADAELLSRCVRGTPLPEANFKDNGNGTVTDATTGLMWQQKDDGKTRNWEAAKAYCESLTLSGHSDWRAPM